MFRPAGLRTPAREGANASMARVSVAEGTRLSVFLARGLLGRVTSRVTAHPIVNWPFSFGKADRIAIAPQDLRTSDATRASEIYAGRFAFGGKVVTCDSRSPFEMAPPSEDWAAALFGFSWLRHLRAAQSGITRPNAGALIELLVDLLPLRSVFTARNLVPPPALLNAIDRMMPMLRFFRHGDSNFALFNGMGPTPTDLLTTVLAYDDARGAPLANAPHSGYQRLESASTLVLMDAGRPPPMAVSQEAHAGCLSFELSARQSRLVVNCGLPVASREGWRQVARTTAAHSTVTFNDTSSCRFIEAGPIRRMLYGTPMIAGPRQVAIEREEQGGVTLLRTSHDGYAHIFNVVHERVLMLSGDGRRLDGEDSFAPARGELVPADRDQFAIRFHLHPTVKANRLSDGHGAMLAMPNKEAWTFSAYGDRVEVEESVYLAGPDGPRRTVQLVIYGRARNVMRVQWTFAPHAVQGPGTAGARRGRDDEPQLPL